MKIVCDSCGAKYSIADEKVAGKIFKIRCKKCSSVLEVRGDQSGAHPFSESSASAEPTNEATWYIVVDGEQKGPLPPIELSQLFAKGAVGLDSYVWKEGFEDWKVAADVAELATIFKGPASAGNDDTSSFGTGGDLFGEGGHEPSSEIDTSSGPFAGFDDAPTPTSADQSPVAASTTDDGGGALGALGGGLGGGAVAATTPERMTGQRNENSVLFSLSNLQQLASRSGGAEQPTSTVSTAQQGAAQAASPSAAGEGSGLIDIRALAKSTTPGATAAPSQSVDDLLAIGTGASSTLGTPLLGPAPLETSDESRWMWIAGAAVAVIAIVGAGVGVGMALGGSDDDALEIAAPAVQQVPAAPTPGTPDTSGTAAQVEQETEEALEAAVVDIEPEQAAEPEEATEAPSIDGRPDRPARASSSAPKRRQRTSGRSAPARKAPAPKRKSNNLDALMDEVVGGSSAPSRSRQTSSSTGSSNSSLPASPSRNDVKTALQGVSGAVKSCRKDSGGTATVNVTFSGKTGRATSARVASGPFKGTPVGACIENAVERARVPRFKQSTFKVTFPYRL